MSWKELICYICVMVTVIVGLGIGVQAWVKSYEHKVAVAKQIEVERVKIEQQAKLESLKIQELETTKRTKERMGWVPWYKGGVK